MSPESVTPQQAAFDAIENLIKLELNGSADPGRFVRIAKLAEMTDRLRGLYVTRAADVTDDYGLGPAGLPRPRPPAPDGTGDLVREMIGLLEKVMEPQRRTAQSKELATLQHIPGSDTRIAELRAELRLDTPAVLSVLCRDCYQPLERADTGALLCRVPSDVVTRRAWLVVHALSDPPPCGFVIVPEQETP